MPNKINMQYILKKITLAGFLFLLAGNSLFADDGAATRRFGLFIGSNNGGSGRAMLRYAVSDAKSISRVFTGMGGITGEDSVLLIEPTADEINRHIDNMGRLSAQARRNSQRTELVFYYSGHSDEDGIFLNRERYSYRELRDRINTVPADMRIVILDSCSSGAITRAKGGVKTQPFLFDNSVSAAGYAFLTSSSDDEVSQESDKIGSSYFTHSLLAGLRGAADSVGDGRVTLNELYRYAYTETLAKTETSLYGAQHPSYDIQISGSGDVVLTDIKEISASIIFSDELTGRLSIRDSSDFLVAELTKVSRKPLELGLEPGLYRITFQRGDSFFRTELSLSENQHAAIGMGNFQVIAAASGDRRRGDEPFNEGGSLNHGDTEDVPVHLFNIQLLPGLDVIGNGTEKATNNFLLGLLVAYGHNIEGIGAASLGLINTGYVRGIQASGIFNIAGDDVSGIQTAGIFNRAGGNVEGIQDAGIFNYSDGYTRGVQAAGIFNYTPGFVKGIQAAGIVNYAGELRGMQAGLVNIDKGEYGSGYGLMAGLVNVSETENIVPFGMVNVVKNGILHGAVFLDDMLFTNISFRSGSKYFYTILSAGLGGGIYPDSGEDTLLIYRSGFGFEFPVNKFFFDIDILFGSIINLDTVSNRLKAIFNNYNNFHDFSNSVTAIGQLRLIAGYRFFRHLGVFAGLSYDYLYKFDEADSPDPRDFGGAFLGGTYGRHTHKLGFFGGIQF